ncbi:uncharacterized protein MYCFIDRAFT_171666 [Pseudocercospora fijiensis CIRAD86]|uniref:F-box domain-containing protein n=1 Tax=Pseudocercospora fijiensis (strain CIRAD86) TaxID=383855 RepID=M3A3X1_PSEFD|nr:uncharacterized protein MYCFIDRAFT_171666 [Pseudocercospora fijiensis CIRAD86]EME85789.1 hypothetical protein MYCFIDRAFT_171666 [Pseudocercospora fijiensis CIRAD86]
MQKPGSVGLLTWPARLNGRLHSAVLYHPIPARATPGKNDWFVFFTEIVESKVHPCLLECAFLRHAVTSSHKQSRWQHYRTPCSLADTRRLPLPYDPAMSIEDPKSDSCAKSNSASTEVFACVELLEAILLQLLIPDLLRAERVCKRWRRVFRASPRLLRFAFLGFVPETGHLSRYVYSNFAPWQGPISLPHPIHPNPSAIEGSTSLATTENATGTKLAVCFNPIFPSIHSVIRLRPDQFRTSLETCQSWFDMYLTQPPTNCVHVTLYYTSTRKSYRKILFNVSRRTHKTNATFNLILKRAHGIRARDILTELRNSTLHSGGPDDWQRIDIYIPGRSPYGWCADLDELRRVLDRPDLVVLSRGLMEGHTGALYWKFGSEHSGQDSFGNTNTHTGVPAVAQTYDSAISAPTNGRAFQYLKFIESRNLNDTSLFLHQILNGRQGRQALA